VREISAEDRGLQHTPPPIIHPRLRCGQFPEQKDGRVTSSRVKIEDLATFGSASVFEADLAIVGGGPAGLTIAREFFGTSVQVLVLESGLLEEASAYAALNELESNGEPSTIAQKQKRIAFHGKNASAWSAGSQPYGVRCRALGGSSHVWAGKSAAFDPIDFAVRSWVPNSGWPITRRTLDPYLDRAANVLNLGPNTYDDGLWDLIGMSPPSPQFDTDALRAFFWQFARSRLDRFDIMRFGQEFVTFKADNVRVLLNATVRQIELSEDGCRLEGLEISTIDGVHSRVKAKAAVIAAGGIENPRLLLASNAIHSRGIGNANDLVGRFLMDHPSAQVGQFEPDKVKPIVDRFGFYGVRHGGRTHMYSHGLALTPAVQEREELLNSAVYFMADRSPDDPWDALKRLLRRNSVKPTRDALSVVSHAGLLVRGVGMKVLASDATPGFLKDLIVNGAIRYSPNFVAKEFQSRGIPHKLMGASIEAITEQRPNPDSRVTLSEKRDRLGVPLAKVDWRINDDERRTISRLALLASETFLNAGLPQPQLERWIAENRPNDAVIIDMAHTIGTTRISNSPASGVVDQDCQVHGVAGLYIAGASTFPTSGHANPTLMILSIAIRLADTIKLRLLRS
jgi:choline dehydrogenase-like flavoprotein